MASKKKQQEYVVCRRCGQMVRGDRFERHAMMHWLTSSSERNFKEFYSEIRGEVVKAQAQVQGTESAQG